MARNATSKGESLRLLRVRRGGTTRTARCPGQRPRAVGEGRERVDEITIESTRTGEEVKRRTTAKLERVQAIRANAAADWHDATSDEMTIPSTIGDEKKTNPFVRAPDATELGRIRTLKDNF